MENLITIITFTLPQDAHFAKAFLESENIETFIKDELTVQVNNFYSNAIGGVKLQVKESDYEKGILVLKEGGYINTENTVETEIEIIHLNETTNKEICPFCHSNNIGKMKETNVLTVIVYFILGVIFPIFKKSHICYDCERAWKFTKKNYKK
jgi:uncharacterized protein YjbK